MLNNKGTILSHRNEQFFKQKTPEKFSNFGNKLVNYDHFEK